MLFIINIPIFSNFQKFMILISKFKFRSKIDQAGKISRYKLIRTLIFALH